MNKWDILSIAVLLALAIIIRHHIDGWEYWVIGVLVIVYGMFKKLSGKAKRSGE